MHCILYIHATIKYVIYDRHLKVQNKNCYYTDYYAGTLGVSVQKRECFDVMVWLVKYTYATTTRACQSLWNMKTTRYKVEALFKTKSKVTTEVTLMVIPTTTSKSGCCSYYVYDYT